MVELSLELLILLISDIIEATQVFLTLLVDLRLLLMSFT